MIYVNIHVSFHPGDPRVYKKTAMVKRTTARKDELGLDSNKEVAGKASSSPEAADEKEKRDKTEKDRQDDGKKTLKHEEGLLEHGCLKDWRCMYTGPI